ncbi:response regulator transcription factor [soil metagenome]
MKNPTVLVVDDAPIFQAGLAAALRGEGFDVVAIASDAMTAIAEARRHRPALVVLDVLMPGISGLDVVDKITDASPESKVVLLTSSDSEEDLLTAIKAGASGYIIKDTPFPKLVSAMNEVVKGGAVVSPKLAARLFDVVAHLLRNRDLNATRRPTLTGREVEILQWISDGRTSREIGEQLYISENTVKNHVRNILDKLGMQSRHEAVRYAEHAGLLNRS